MEFWKVFLVTTVLCSCVLRSTLGVSTTYVVALLGLDIQNDSTLNIDISYELVIVNGGDAKITVRITSISSTINTLTVAANGREVYPISGYTMAMNGSEFSNKTLEVHSDDGEFVLQVFSKRENYVEGLLAIPIEDMDGPNQVIDKTVYEYVVATFCAVGGYCQIAIAAAENNTEVFIDIPKHIEEIALCNKTSYFRTQRDTRFTMNRFDALQLETTYDLTGTVIFSFKPIAVFVGSRNVTNGNVVAHTMEQLVPSSHWGTEFVVQTLGSNGYGDILKIVSPFTNTEVTMSGFPSFNMADRYQTVTRRLSSGMRSYIKGSHPIQVIQISGLSYATQDESSTLSMTVVPSVQNAWNEFIISCHSTHTTSQFHVVSEKEFCSKTIVGTQTYECDSNVFESGIKYIEYLIGTIQGTSGMDTTRVSNAATTINGVLKCDTTVTMPLGVRYNENVTGTTPFNVPEHPGGICYEGGKATTYFSSIGTAQLPNILDLTEYSSDHVWKLRLQVCGSAVLHFTSQSLDEFIVAIVGHTGVHISKYSPQCTIEGTSNITDSANMVDGFDCMTDMSFIWVRQATGTFCIGTGYRVNTEMCLDQNTYNDLIRIKTNSENLFSSVSMIGEFSDATLNWDFIHVDGCKEYANGSWRCMDKLLNCSQYEDGFCSAYQEFASFYCAKSCGICYSDSYGRKFMVKPPSDHIGQCSLLISPLNKDTHVATIHTLESGADQYETVLHGSRDMLDAISYNCTDIFINTMTINTITILSDDDVAVVMYHEIEDVTKATRMYPVDTFGHEFMILDHSTNQKECRFQSEYDDVDYEAYFSEQIDPELTPSDLLFSMSNGQDMSGTSFIFTRPSSVFCFDTIEYIYNQLMPIDTWSNEYVVPGFDINSVKYPLTGKLHIVATTDNTIVTISGGFDAIHAIYNKGDKVEQKLDVTTSYKVVASERIGVGLYIGNSARRNMSSFVLLAPIQNHHDTVLTTASSVRPEDDLDSTKRTRLTETEIFTSYINADLTSTKEHTSDLGDEWAYQILDTRHAQYELTLVHSKFGWYIIPGNVKAKYLNQASKDICSVSVATSDDGVDNDCDGLVDEEGFYEDAYGVYKEDNDMDGDFGNDCGGSLIAKSAIVTAPKEPICLELEEVPGQCLAVCLCPCSWLTKLAFYKNMSRAELIEALKKRTLEIINAIKVDRSKLSATRITLESADDERRSAKSIGWVGVAFFALIFGTIFIMDVQSLKRDALILWENLCDGYDGMCDFVKRERPEPETTKETRF